jgi:hypothetical protein
VAERSEAQVCGRLIAGIAGSNPDQSIYVRLVFICCVVLRG